MKLTDLYRSILRFSGMDSDDEGYISTVIDDKREATIVNGARLVLPLPNQFRGYNPADKMIFHPLTENILRGESDVLVKLKTSINIKLNFSLGIIAQHLLNLIASPEYHSKLSPEQAELLTSVNDADEKAVINFINIMVKGAKIDPGKLFVNIYIKRGGVYNGKKAARVGVVSFPFYQNLVQGKVDGIRVKDKETFKQLFDYILPNISVPDEYNACSDSNVAPYLETLMHTAANVASRINDMILLFKDHIDNAESLLFDSDWMDAFTNLEAMQPEIRKIPVQHGNDGNISVIEEAPVPAPVPMQQMQQPMYMPQQPQMPVYMQPQPKPEVKETKRGIDFNSIKQMNPAMAYQQNSMMPFMQAPMQAQGNANMMREPSWAQAPMQQQMPMYPQQMQQQMPMYPQQMPMQQQMPMYPQQQMPMYPQQMQQQMPMQPGQMVLMPNGQWVMQ